VSPGSANGGTWWGTLEFVAPEVANHGAVAYSPASDWWGLGVLIYNLLLGLTPWDGEGYDEQLRQIQTGDVLWPPEGMVSGTVLTYFFFGQVAVCLLCRQGA
jgi:serine/threonine protein kinase